LYAHSLHCPPDCASAARTTAVALGTAVLARRLHARVETVEKPQIAEISMIKALYIQCPFFQE
jgi:hypothetical protein